MGSMSETLNPNELPAVARNINLPCKKCGVDRFHVVVAHKSATSAKVKCEVCGAQSTYKLAKPKAEKKPGAAKTGKKTPKVKAPDHAAIWNELKEQIGTENARPYNMKTKFELANAINHPKFGIGFVTNLTAERIDVAFPDASRGLVHNRP